MFFCSSSSRRCRELSTCLLSSESSSSRIFFLSFCQCSNLFFQRLEPIVSFFIYKQSPSQHLCHLDSGFSFLFSELILSTFTLCEKFFWYISPRTASDFGSSSSVNKPKLDLLTSCFICFLHCHCADATLLTVICVCTEKRTST